MLVAAVDDLAAVVAAGAVDPAATVDEPVDEEVAGAVFADAAALGAVPAAVDAVEAVAGTTGAATFAVPPAALTVPPQYPPQYL